MKNNSVWIKYRSQIIASLILTCLPVVVTLILIFTGAWPQNPDSVSKWMLMVPVIGTVGVVLVAFWCTFTDPGQAEQSEKVMNLLLMFFPFLSISISIFNYALSYGFHMNSLRFFMLLMALILIGFGNFLPKLSQNRSFGFRLPWTLVNAQNWKMTHRFGGKVWVICGLIILLLQFVPETIAGVLSFIVLVAAVIIPTYYSWKTYQKLVQEGKAEPLDEAISKPGNMKISGRKLKKDWTIGTIMTLVLFAGAIVLINTGSVDANLNKETDTLKLTCTYWPSKTIPLDEIKDIQLDSNFNPGSRTNGLGTLKVLAGTFQNYELGTYTLYAPANTGKAIVITSKSGRIIAFAKENPDETEVLFKEIVRDMDKLKQTE